METPILSNLHLVCYLNCYAAKLGSFSWARRFAILTASTSMDYAEEIEELLIWFALVDWWEEWFKKELIRSFSEQYHSSIERRGL
jgi:hypothetical protein